MAISKVVYGGKTLIDITNSTVTADNLADGAIAYGANGERIVGTAKISNEDLNQVLAEQEILIAELKALLEEKNN